MREYSIGKRLIEGYLHQPYTWFIDQYSSKLGKNILSEVSQVVGGIIMPFITIITQGAVILALLILILIIDTKLAIYSTLTLSLIYGTIYFLIKNYLYRKGAERLKANEVRFSAVSEAFNAIKEIKIFGIENYFINKFDKSAKLYANNLSLIKIIGQLPRYAIEGIAFGALIFLVFILMEKDKVFSDIAPIIALYAFAGYRLMPALQQIYSSFSQLRFSHSTLDILYNDLNLIKNLNVPENNKTINLKKTILLKNVSYSYPYAESLTLKNIDLSIPALSKVGIVGKTGSGKTTIVDIIMGLLDHKQGNLKIDDKIITVENKRSWQKNIGYVPQQIYLSDNSIKSNIAFGIDQNKIDQSAVESAAKIANLHNFVINELSDGYETLVGEKGVKLSGGQRQRIVIARALYHKPELLILDEATSALDNMTEKAVLDAINNLNKKITIIIIAHRLNTVKNCDKIFLIEKGQLKAQGTFKEVLDNESFMYNKKE